MRKRKLVIALTIITVLSIVLSLFGYNWYRSIQIDSSWIETAESMLNDYHSFVNVTKQIANSPDWFLSPAKLYLLDNGTENILYFGGGDNLTIYLENILNQASIKKGTISDTQLEQILASSKVLEMTFRIISSQHHFYSRVYFILESNQNQDMIGTIIAKNQSPNLDILAVSKLPKSL